MSELRIKPSKTWVKQSLRLLHHEFRRGELTIIFLAIVLAVGTVFSLTGFSEQIKQAIITNSANTIAADRVLGSSRAIPTEYLDKSDSLSLNVASKILLDSMVFSGDNMLLSELDIISEKYPLRGEFLVKMSLDQEVPTSVSAPKQGTAYVEESILSRLNVKIGGTIEVGVLPLTIAGVIVEIPDRSYRMFVAGPAIFFNIKDIDKTQLIKPGSRVYYQYLFAGERDDIETFETWIKPQLNETQNWYDAKSAKNRLSKVLDSSEKFLSLASMLGIVLAAVAVAVASRRYGQRHQPMVAVFKALGASTSHVKKLYMLHWGLLSLISIIVGLIVGYMLMLAGVSAIESYLSLDESQLTFKPFVTAVITGLLCAIAFAIHPITELISTKPLDVIRGFSQSKLPRFGWHQVIPLLALFALLMLFSRDLIMSLSLLLGGILVSGILLLLGRLIMGAGRSAGAKAGKAWHLALANLKRRANENSVQLVSFTIAIQLLLLITVMKSSIIDEWQAQFPENTPNHYLLNIANEEIAPLQAFAEELNLDNQGFYPIFRGRLSAINGEKTVSVDDDDKGSSTTETDEAKEEEQDKPKERKGAGRELSLTWQEQLPLTNEVVEGQWWQIKETLPQVSMEKGMAERLDIKLGDELTFTIGTDEFTVPVTSIRDVDWKSRQLNFIMIFNEAAVIDIATTSISAWMISDQQKNEVYRFLSQYPTISIMDFGAIMKQLTSMIEQVSIAIELILVLVILAGSLVLVAQVQASMEERERELAILRTLGAKGSLLRNSVLFEFVALGAVAGLMASIAMEIAVFFLQTQVFEMSASFHFSYWLVGIVAGAGFVGIMGMLSCWRLLNMSSLTLIRRTM
ncbi:ABC transporter permease [Colwellia hornerae]|uniref:FtsX-like permease family protein n=1 Tax=Colwellia hornerae TaxID=89402 RepID=A0A5C6QSE9_9GAMM|nr:FtsX-like permease family protein [Colwellia hornerae]TWX57700.1 FtsX-like permease family protein [Colwellia hornerae]TWX62569.1 FtsX-like permease family protein [Colwellia hornerae]TWX71481.1 FtsX-like permease family protein [Colwellia hornerae]